jgi:site-specific recombinase
MKITLMKFRVMWRRFRRTSPQHNEHQLRYIPQIEALMRRASPFASWSERANWMIDIGIWLRRPPPHIRPGRDVADVVRRAKQQRTQFLLDWLDSNRDVKRIVQTTLQKTLREAIGPELFCATGLPREPAFFSELGERVSRFAFPKTAVKQDLSTLFAAMFPDAADAEWLLGLDQATLYRIWKLCADDGISHGVQQQVDEALIYLVTMIISTGIGTEFRQRLEPHMPFRATPFMALRRELEKYLVASPNDAAALRSVRMLIAVCQAQTDRIYAHLDEHGVSVGLVYKVERMRAQLVRMSLLIDLRSGLSVEQSSDQIHALLVDLIDAHHRRSSVQGLVNRSFSLLARKMVERNADRGEQYAARSDGEYRTVFRSACRGGVMAAIPVVAKNFLPAGGAARFFEGAFSSMNHAAGLAAISAAGGTLAATQPAVTAPALAARMHSLDTVDGLRRLLEDIASMLRSQAASVLGNLATVIPTVLVVALGWLLIAGATMVPADKAAANIDALSLIGPSPLYAAFTGVLLWLSGLAAGVADNWFALSRLRDVLAHHRRLVHVFGPMRSERFARWLEARFARIAGILSLAVLLGLSPVLLQFFGMPLDVRHVTLDAGALAAASVSLGWKTLLQPSFWLAASGILVTGMLNAGVGFACSLALAMRARDVPLRMRRIVAWAVLRRLGAAPWKFMFPERARIASAPVEMAEPAAPELEPRLPMQDAGESERRTGSDR